MFGQEMVRALLHLPGDSTPVPTYLPDPASREPPLLRRFEVRLLGEARRKVEDGASMAVKILACALR
ncbi:MAG: hypothetical protein R3B70_07375 [Polyangiaceae bacterium]